MSGEADWDFMQRIIAQNYTFVTNNARDFRKLYARQELHVGLVIIVPQVLPTLQRELFGLVLRDIADQSEMINEVIEVTIEKGEAVITPYLLPPV